MWHRLTLTAEQDSQGEEIRILDIVDRAVLENWQVTGARLDALRSAGVISQIPLQETPVEMDSFWEEDTLVLHLNDAALRLYQANGGTCPVESSIPDLPHGRPASLMRIKLFSVA